MSDSTVFKQGESHGHLQPAPNKIFDVSNNLTETAKSKKKWVEDVEETQTGLVRMMSNGKSSVKLSEDERALLFQTSPHPFLGTIVMGVVCMLFQ